MFEDSLKLGRNLLKSAADDADRKDRFLKSQAIIPETVDDDKATGDREIVIDLDTENGEVNIYLGDELVLQNRNTFFAFKSPSNSKKFYFATNNLHYHLVSLDEMIRYIHVNMNNQHPEFAKFLISLRKQFYQEDEEDRWFLNPDNLENSLKKQFEKYYDGNNNKDSIEDALEEFVSKEILGSTRKGFVKNIDIYTLKIDGVRAHEKDFLFKKEYIDIVFFDLKERFFDTSKPMVRKEAICSGCQKQTKVTGKIDIPTKFYITDKPTFFEELNKNSAYKSFALCEECYQELMVGIDHIQNEYSGNLFGANYYLVPRTVDVRDLDKKMAIIQRRLFAKSENLEDEVEQHGDLIKIIRKENLRFDFLFHWTPPGQGAAFVVAEYISNVEYKTVDDVLKTIQNFKFGFYSELGSLTAGLNHIYWLLFPNSESHSNPDTDLYRKELLHIFKSLMKGGTLLYPNLLRKFLSIYSKTKFRKHNYDRSFAMRPLQMHMLLSLFYEHSNLQGLNTMNSQKPYTDIRDDKVREFFETHPEIYKDNSHRQGLVMLGILMNKIRLKQVDDDKSSTIVDKLNFDGIPVTRVPKLGNEITKYLNMRTYDLYHFNSVLHAEMGDRLHNIENSSLSKDEVVFYIMTGISLSNYIGYQHNQAKQLKKGTNE